MMKWDLGIDLLARLVVATQCISFSFAFFGAFEVKTGVFSVGWAWPLSLDTCGSLQLTMECSLFSSVRTGQHVCHLSFTSFFVLLFFDGHWLAPHSLSLAAFTEARNYGWGWWKLDHWYMHWSFWFGRGSHTVYQGHKMDRDMLRLVQLTHPRSSSTP